MKIWTINIIGFTDEGEEYLEDQRGGYGCWEDANQARRKLFAPGGAYKGFDGYAKIVGWVSDEDYKFVVQDDEGRDIDFEAAVELMDDEIREDVHMNLDSLTPQKFFDAYCVRHLCKYGEPFRVN